MNAASNYKTLVILILFFLITFFSCSSTTGVPDDTALESNILRSCMTVREINWAGSMSNAGVYDPDDDFIELANTDCGITIDITDWKIIMKGDTVRTYIFPAGDNNTIEPNALMVIATKADGAFGQSAQLIMPTLLFPERNFTIETRTNEDFLIENSMNARHDVPLAGGFDGYTTRSMERTDDKFDEDGGFFTSWHSSTPCNEFLPGSSGITGTGCTNAFDENIGLSGANIHADYNLRTFATPGELNTGEYR